MVSFLLIVVYFVSLAGIFHLKNHAKIIDLFNIHFNSFNKPLEFERFKISIFIFCHTIS